MVMAVPASPGPSAPELEWHFSQVFGERTPGEEVQDGERDFREPRCAGQAVTLTVARRRLLLTAWGSRRRPSSPLRILSPKCIHESL